MPAERGDGSPTPIVAALRRDLRSSVTDGVAHASMVGLGETYVPAFALALGHGAPEVLFRLFVQGPLKVLTDSAEKGRAVLQTRVLPGRGLVQASQHQPSPGTARGA